MVSRWQIFGRWGSGHNWVKILSFHYQCSDPVSSLNSPPLHLQHIVAGRESHSMFGATTINMQLIEFTTLASGAAGRSARMFEELAEKRYVSFSRCSHTQHLSSLEFLEELQNFGAIVAMGLLSKPRGWVWCLSRYRSRKCYMMYRKVWGDTYYGLLFIDGAN